MGSGPPVRLLVVAHAPTAHTREAVFGDGADCLPLGEPARLARVASWCSGPEPAAQQTAAWLGSTAAAGSDEGVVERLAGGDFGTWSGRTLTEVGRTDPGGLALWLSDPYAAPHGGESLADLQQRVGVVLDQRDWPPGRSVVAVAPLVARALAVRALGAAADVIFRIDIAPLDLAALSRSGRGWRLQGLRPLR